jgi:mannose-6-phosphate isomerase-like protein (cupin superfamily)
VVSRLRTPRAAGASNTGAHRDTDEAIYFLSAGGRTFVGTDTTTVEPGLMLWVPRGVRHGFFSPADRPMRFIWVNFPHALALRFRESGVTPGAPCPPARSP